VNDIAAISEIKKRRGGTVRKVPPPSREGSLMKKARGKKMFGSEWQTRLFQLEMGQLHFTDARTSSKNKIRDTITLQGLHITRHTEDNCIIEVHASPVLYLKASNEGEATSWYESLCLHKNYI
jgi:hypothetical protein